MKFEEDLASGTSTKIAKAAKSIIKDRAEGYCQQLLSALDKEIEKPRAWKSQCQLIKALAIINCTEAIPKLKMLIKKDYKHTILYRELAFSICVLENINQLNLAFLFISIESGNHLQIAGACSAILYKKIVPTNSEIEKILAGIAPYTEDEGMVVSPRCYIAALAYLWPREVTRTFLEDCKKSDWHALVDIANDSLQQKEPKIKLV